MLNLHDIRRAERAVWEADLEALPTWRARLVLFARLVHAVARDLADGQITLRAMSLVYTTLLSLVPLLAVSFSVLKAFGVHNQIEPVLLAFLAPLGEKGREVTETVIGFVENIRVGVLGALGLGFLLYTVTALVQKIEFAFNFTWHIKHPRPLAQRFSQYLSVLTVGPVMVFSALGITASLMNNAIVQALVAVEPMGTIVALLGKLIPYGLVIGAFTFLYIFIPNTRVRVTSALAGGVVAGVLWQSSGWAFASFIVASSRYTAIYSGFAIVIMFMVWLYLSWLILLVGGSFAFYHQHPEHLAMRRRDLQLSHGMKEKLALVVMAAIVGNYYRGQPPWTPEALAQRARVPMQEVEEVIETLAARGIIQQTADEPPRYLPARPPQSVPLKELLDIVRGGPEDAHRGGSRLAGGEPVIEELVQAIDGALQEALRGRTLEDLALADSATKLSATPGPAAAGAEHADPDSGTAARQAS